MLAVTISMRHQASICQYLLHYIHTSPAVPSPNCSEPVSFVDATARTVHTSVMLNEVLPLPLLGLSA